MPQKAEVEDGKECEQEREQEMHEDEEDEDKNNVFHDAHCKDEETGIPLNFLQVQDCDLETWYVFAGLRLH